MSEVRKKNFLDHIPTRLIESRVDEQGYLFLVLPKFGNGRLSFLWSSLIGERRSFLRIHLDEVGSTTWSFIDGQRTIAQIADLVDERHEIDARYERCTSFVQTLLRSGAISLREPD